MVGCCSNTWSATPEPHNNKNYTTMMVSVKVCRFLQLPQKMVFLVIIIAESICEAIINYKIKSNLQNFDLDCSVSISRVRAQVDAYLWKGKVYKSPGRESLLVKLMTRNRLSIKCEDPILSPFVQLDTLLV